STLAFLHSSGTVKSLLSIRDEQVRIQVTLYAVQRRLQAALKLGEAEIVPFPMYYGGGFGRCHAAIPNIINMQVVGTTWLVPKPYGPVLAVERAVQILTELQQKFKLPWRTPKNMPLLEYWYNVAYAPF